MFLNNLKILHTVVIAGFCMALFAALSVALGDDSATTYSIDIQSTASTAITFIFGAIGAAILWGAKRLISLFEKKTGLEIDDNIRSYLLAAVDSAISWAVNKAETKVSGLSPIEVESEIVSKAVNYLLERVPEAVEHFGLDEDALKDLITARLDQWFVEEDTTTDHETITEKDTEVNVDSAEISSESATAEEEVTA